MGKATRPKPKRLAEKLVQLRHDLDLSQNGIIKSLGLAEELTQAEISAFERGIREPPLPLLLRYAKIAGICTDTLIDDELDLPKKLPARPKHTKIVTHRH